MKRFLSLGLFFLVFVGIAATAMASGFYATTNEVGYQGTIWNMTDGTGPWTTSTPRDAVLYTVVGVPGSPNYNILASNWSEHSISNQNPSFFQLYETGNASVTSAIGGWDPAHKVFTVSISGQNAPYPWSRFWQPDTGVAWGVTFTNYSYAFTATFPTAAIPDSGGYASVGSPDTIVGSFTGQFVITADVNKNPITNGDTYGFDLTLSKALFAPLDATDAYGGATKASSSFGTVPEPGTLMLLGFGLVGLVAACRKVKKG